jgi:sigma-B regulation protein RsbU (phosphoserine phosphatase)
MFILSIQDGPDEAKDRQFSLKEGDAVIGRASEADIRLLSSAVSRRHARICLRNGECSIEDLASRYGVFLNGQRIEVRTIVKASDELRIGDYLLKVAPVEQLRPGVRTEKVESYNTLEEVRREVVDARSSNRALYAINPTVKLQAVLELSQHLSMTLEEQPLLDKLLDHLLNLFPVADEALVVLCQEGQLVVRGERARNALCDVEVGFSRSLIKQALADGVGILSPDVQVDDRFGGNVSLRSTKARSLMCVPLIAHDGNRLGAIQLACCAANRTFEPQDLHLLTTISLQVAVVLENAALNAEHLREAQFRKELAMAQQIQKSVLPIKFAAASRFGCDIYAQVWSAREVSGDFYDFFVTEKGNLAFLVGDVSGKGMPAALFMFAARSLERYLVAQETSPAQALARLDQALAADNTSAMFVTILLGIMDAASGEIVLCSGGHPAPLVRRCDGRIDVAELAPGGRILGLDAGPLRLADTRLTLAPGETLILYTDGCTEAFAPDGRTMYGVGRLRHALSHGGDGPLKPMAEGVRDRVVHFSGSSELQDDVTLLILRRNAAHSADRKSGRPTALKLGT